MAGTIVWSNLKRCQPTIVPAQGKMMDETANHESRGKPSSLPKSYLLIFIL